MATAVLSSPGIDSYKYQWSRYVARRNLEAGVEALKEKVGQNSNIPGINIPMFKDLAELAARQGKVTVGQKPTEPGRFKVGIVGAGAAGLFTGMIIDFLNSRVNGLNIEYDILEAAKAERLGGRLYTHYFTKGEGSEHDYYDVGAMRFPNNDIMHRTFQLFDLLGITKNGKLIKYYMEDEDRVCPTYYNDARHRGPPKGDDPYNINATLPDHDKVPAELLTEEAGGAGKVVSRVIKPFADAVKRVLDENRAPITKKDPEWKLLIAGDQLSTRQFFRSTDIPDVEDIKGPGFSFNTIEWLETFAYATGWYNQSLTETVLEELDFDADDWFCIEGGTQQVAFKMAEKLTKKPEFERQVTAIKAHPDGKMTLTIKHNDSKNKVKETENRDYFAVFNSTTLAALQRMDLKDAGLRYGTKQAIRSLSYGASCKVGMKFKTGWWMKPPHNIKKGGIAKTDLPLRVCVYPSYNLQDSDKECVLLCSYTWAQDAQRIGSLITPDTKDKDPMIDEEELLNTLFHNLALLHATDDKPYQAMLDQIKAEYETHHSWDWYCDQNMSGAFAYFGPGQYSSMSPEVIKPNGWLFLIGEAASAHHAWIVGSLESAVRGVYNLLETLFLQENYAGYQEAMKHLEKPNEEDSHLPFGPLPRELPARQAGTNKDTPTVDLPKDATTPNADLTFTAAQIILSFFETLVEEAERAAAKEKIS